MLRRYILVNRLADAVPPPRTDAAVAYLGFVEVVLQLLARNQGGAMGEEELLTHWLPKLGVEPKQHLPYHQSQTVEDLVTKRMVAEAYLKKGKNAVSNETEYVPGARALLCRDATAAEAFQHDTVTNRQDEAA